MFNFIYLVGMLVLAPVLVYRRWRFGKYSSDLAARFFGPTITPNAHKTNATLVRTRIWIHAVSVGEVLLLKPVLSELVHDHALDIHLSVGTDSGLAIAVQKYLYIHIFRAPLDFSWAIDRAFNRVKPDLLVLTELELWPNLLLTAKKNGIPVAVINMRLSKRSHRGYCYLMPCLRNAFSAVTWWGVQNEEYTTRLTNLLSRGSIPFSLVANPLTDSIQTIMSPRESDHPVFVQTTGSIKYDGVQTKLAHHRLIAYRQMFGWPQHDPVIVAGSTQAPEEAMALDAFDKLRVEFPSLRLILVPRHPERFDEVARLIEARQLAYVRRSTLPSIESFITEQATSSEHAQRVAPHAGARHDAHDDESIKTSSPAIVLLDTMGELSTVWGLAQFGFVGGSFDGKRGGQSMIEPAGFGVPVCFGPHTWNFKATVESLLAVDAARQLTDPNELLPTWRHWLTSPESARKMGDAAQRFILSQQGATERTVQALRSLLPKRPHDTSSSSDRAA